jgi:hypothetical protein
MQYLLISFYNLQILGWFVQSIHIILKIDKNPNSKTPNLIVVSIFYGRFSTIHTALAVNIKVPAVNRKVPAVKIDSPTVNRKVPAVKIDSPTVNRKVPAVKVDSPTVNIKALTVNIKPVNHR